MSNEPASAVSIAESIKSTISKYLAKGGNVKDDDEQLTDLAEIVISNSEFAASNSITPNSRITEASNNARVYLNQYCYNKVADDYSHEGMISNKKCKSSSVNYGSSFVNFCLDDLPDYEPLEIFLQVLRRDCTDGEVLIKLAEDFDMGELVEHPQWVEFLSLLYLSLSNTFNPHIISTVAIHSKLLIALSGYQFVDVSLNILNHLYNIWCRQDVHQFEANSHTQMVSKEILDIVYNFDLIRMYISIICQILENLKDHIVGAPEKSTNQLIATMFLILAHGKIELELAEAVVLVPILQLLVKTDEDGSSLESLCTSWIPIQIFHHCLQSTFSRTLNDGISQSIKLCKQTLHQFDYTSDSGDISASRNVRDIFIDNIESHIQYYLLLLRMWLAIAHPYRNQIPFLSILADQHEITSSPYADMFWDGSMESKPSQFGSTGVQLKSVASKLLNKKHWRLSSKAPGDLPAILLRSKSTLITNHQQQQEFQMFFESCVDFLVGDVLTHLEINVVSNEGTIDSLLVVISQILSLSKSLPIASRNNCLQQFWSSSIAIYNQSASSELPLLHSISLNIILLCLEFILPELEAGYHPDSTGFMIEIVVQALDLLAGHYAIVSYTQQHEINLEVILDNALYLLLESSLRCWITLMNMNSDISPTMMNKSSFHRIVELLPNIVGFSLNLLVVGQKKVENLISMLISTSTTVDHERLNSELCRIRKLSVILLECISDSLVFVVENFPPATFKEMFSFFRPAIYHMLFYLLSEGLENHKSSTIVHSLPCNRIIRSLGAVLVIMTSDVQLKAEIATLFDEDIYSLTSRRLAQLACDEAVFEIVFSPGVHPIYTRLHNFLTLLVLLGLGDIFFMVWIRGWPLLSTVWAEFCSADIAFNRPDTSLISLPTFLQECQRQDSCLLSTLEYDPLHPLFIQELQTVLLDATMLQVVRDNSPSIAIKEEAAAAAMDVTAIFKANLDVMISHRSACLKDMTNLCIFSQDIEYEYKGYAEANEVARESKQQESEQVWRNLSSAFTSEFTDNGELLQELQLRLHFNRNPIDETEFVLSAMGLISNRFGEVFMSPKTLHWFSLALLQVCNKRRDMIALALLLNGSIWTDFSPSGCAGGCIVHWLLQTMTRKLQASEEGRLAINILTTHVPQMSLLSWTRILLHQWFYGFVTHSQLVDLTIRFVSFGPSSLADSLAHCIIGLAQMILLTVEDSTTMFPFKIFESISLYMSTSTGNA